MRVLISLVSLLLACAAPGLAHADWRWTRWDMSLDQLKAAADTPLTDETPRPGSRVHQWDLLASGTTIHEGFDFRTEFYFDREGKGLKAVRLSLNDPEKCDALQARMIARHGPPLDKSQDLEVLQLRVLVWEDDGAGNFLGLTGSNAIGQAGANCFLRYRPIGYVDGPK